MCLPTLELFRRYPTIGPDGETENDIDGRACSIELYLGRQALSDVEGKLRPVRWAGFNEKMKRYQGAVSEKNHVQVRFEEILEDIRKTPASEPTFDLAGIRAVFEAILLALTTR